MMTRRGWISWTAAAALMAAVLSAQPVVRGDVPALIETIRNAMPGSGTNAFVVPGNTDLAVFQNVFSLVKNGAPGSVQTQLTPYAYTIVSLVDTGSGDTCYAVTEAMPVKRGWGTYLFNPRGTNDLMIECPHPIWDTKSWKLGIAVWRRLKARWFAMAGTHRYANTDNSSDMAHVTQSVFMTAHKAVAAPTAIQIHGFDKSNADYTGYPDVVISNGTLYPPTALFTLETQYEARGFTAGVYSFSTQSSLSLLGATTNKQGQWSASYGKTFIHCEHDYPLRTNETKFAGVVEAFASAFAPSAAGRESAREVPAAFTLEQNYPNPCNPTSTIRYSVPAQSAVSLKVYDMLGREVAVLVDRVEPAGIHIATVDASRFAGGVYVYRLSVNGHAAARRMVVVK